jgi:hypothetical protein
MAEKQTPITEESIILDKESKPLNTPPPETEDFLDDDDAIEKLLMDEMFNETDEVELPDIEQNAENLEEIDEFADDDLEEVSQPDDPAPEPVAEISPSVDESTPTSASDDDSYIDDFDITSDEVISESPNQEIIEEHAEKPFESQNVQDALINSVNGDQNSNQETLVVEKTQATDSVIGEALTAQVGQLWAEVDELKQQSVDPSDDVDQLKKKLKRTFLGQEETNKKNKLFASMAMGIAALASIIAIVAIIQNNSLNNTITEMNGLITDMEEASSEPDITTEKTLKNLKDSYLLLDNNQMGLRNQLATLKIQLNAETNEPSQNEITIQNTLSNMQTQVTDIETRIKTLATSVAKRPLVQPRKKAKKARANAKPIADWTVNLVSFKQDWYAKKKATEFKNKGIPVEIAPVVVKGDQWYRLRVTGFKTKYEAGSYASRAKKALNLSSVWVTQE